MKHHFADLLDRNGDYWSIIPNSDRYEYNVCDIPSGAKEIRVITITKEDSNWEVIFTLPNLEELTLHEPNKDQLVSVSKLWNLKRLRITHARPKDIEFIGALTNLEELILEYVSGFSDLSPLSNLPKLKSIHFENLRKVSDFKGLSGIGSLKYLNIDGTFDWKQPISNFEFLYGLPNLEVLALGQVINKTPYPALLPALSLKKLKYFRTSWTMLEAEEYALLEVGLPNVEGTVRGPYTRFAYSSIRLPSDDIRAHLSDDVIKKNHPEVIIDYAGERSIKDPNDTWLEFTGKKAGRTKVGSPKEQQNLEAYINKYNEMKIKAKQIVLELNSD